jgi:enhancing lycopene biosynthesis protein 2
MKKRIGVVFSGCGVNDGTEIHEAVSLMIALDKQEIEMVFLAPDIPQMHVVNHQTGQVCPDETRNVLVESARIARGPVTPITEIDVTTLDGLAFPGGFGAAKNLSDFAINGEKMTVNKQVKTLVNTMHLAGKPILSVCISPAILAAIFGTNNISFTIGNDKDTANVLESFGGSHVNCTATEVCVDRQLKLVTAPAYMLASGPAEVYKGITRAVENFILLLNEA